MVLDFLAGCIGGCVGIVVGHPLDTVKVIMQVEQSQGGIFKCIRDIIAKDSIRGLYRGVTSPMASIGLINATVFGIYGTIRDNSTDPNALITHAVAGTTAGLFQSFICSPVELAKTRLQIGCTGRAAEGPIACLKEIYKKEGGRGIFRGLSLTALRDIPAFACYFVTYEIFSKNSDGSRPSTLKVLMAGGLAGVASWSISFPIDSLKSRIQADGLQGPRQYTNSMDCLKKSLVAEGPKFLVRGLSAVLLRAFPSNAACFLAVDWCMNISTVFNGVTIVREPMQICDLHYAAHAYKSLLFASSFSETICSNDISELHEDFGDVKKRNGICGRCLLSIPVKIGIMKEVKIKS